MERLKNVIKKLQLKDLAAPFIFIIMLVPSLIFKLANRLSRRRLWLVAEDGEARDNGYHFYRYVREKHPEDFCFYAVRPESSGRSNIKKLGNMIAFGSLRHWLYYMAADLNISSQTTGNPSKFFWQVMHAMLGLYKNRVFLQHGIMHNDSIALHYKNTKFEYFIAGAWAEYDFLTKTFGYDNNNILLTGLPRWDNLKNNRKENTILIMPTWRKYLGIQNNALFSGDRFENTSYFQKWNGLLNNSDFIEFIEKNKIKVYFYPHQNVQEKIKSFSSPSKQIKILSMENDIQKYLSECSLMITDYSSVAFDFAYLGKPVIYYQFDMADYRKKQHGEGYFKYEHDGFGPVVGNQNDLLEQVQIFFNVGFDEEYAKRASIFFSLKDRKNSERIYGTLARKRKNRLARRGRQMKILALYIICMIFPRLRSKYKDIWLISERGDEARDNGYALYKYIKEHHPKIRVRYVISKDSADFSKISSKDVVFPGTFEHCKLFVSAKCLISAHIMGFAPDRGLFTTLDAKNLVKTKGKRVFLQHGITYNRTAFSKRQNKRHDIDLFICGAYPELRFMQEDSYLKGNILQLTGFARWDNYLKKNSDNYILVMPTWRRNLVKINSIEEFRNTKYFKKWNELINDETLHMELERHNVRLLFYPHYEFQKYAPAFTTKTKNITIVTATDCDVNELLAKCKMLVTDYSSVLFDAHYMRKPVLYYQFDEKEFRESQYAAGWYNFEYGKKVSEKKQAIAYVAKKLNDGFTLEKDYRSLVDKCFTANDGKNCERIYDEICKISKEQR